MGTLLGNGVHGWLWEVEFIDNSAVEKLSEDVGTLLESLRERLSIGKGAAVYLKDCLKRDVDWNFRRLTYLPLLSDYLLDIPKSEPVVGCFEWKPVVSDDWVFNTEFKLFDFASLIPREAIVIRKDITNYIKDCIRSRIELPKLKMINEAVELKRYIVDFTPISSNTTALAGSGLRKLPLAIEIVEETGAKYIDEVIDYGVCDYESLPDTKTQLQKLKTEEDYSIYQNEVLESSTPLNLSFLEWNFEIHTIDHRYFESLEHHCLGEELQKGVEYRIDPPFMDDAPIFKELMSAFEYACVRLPPSCSVSDLRLPGFKRLVDTIDKGALLEEIMENEDLVFYIKAGTGLERIRSFDSYIIPYSSHEKPKLPEVEISPTEATVHMTNIYDSNVKLFETTELSNDTEATGSEDTIGATKMSTFLNLTQHNVEKKRSIDDELDALITKRRKNVQNDGDSSMLPILKLLKGGVVEDFTPEEPLVEDNFIAPKLAVNSFKFEFDSTNCIIFNSFYMNENSKVFVNLDKISKLKILEYDLDELGPDFLISSTFGVLLIYSSTIDQVNVDGILKLQPRIIHNKKLLHKLHVIIITNGLIRKDLIFNFQLSLSILGITSVVVDFGVNLIANEISTVGYFEGLERTEEEMEKIENNHIQYLVSCGVNPFASLEILSQMNILEFLTMEKEEMNEKYSNTLTKSTITHVYELFNVSWSID